MTKKNSSDKYHLPSHTQILDKTGSGKSVLVASKLLEELSQTPSHLKINFRPRPSQ